VRFVMDARYAGPRASGIGAYARAIGTRLPALAPESRFRFWLRAGSAPIATSHNVTHARVTPPAAGLATLLWPNRLDALAPDDVFHGTANILGFGLPCSTVVTVHDVMWLEHLAWCQPRPWLRPISAAYYGTGILRALREADRLLTVSHASADAILRIEPGARDRLVVAPNACEAHFHAPASRERARALAAECLGSAEPYFLVVGQNQPSKAHAVAVEAFAAADVPGQQLVLVQRLEPGRGLHSLVRRLGIEARVKFVAGVELESLVALLQSATALVHPSLAEGFGLPVLEAMACGSPVIGSDIPPLREILGPAAHLVPPGEVAPLARALERATREPSRLAEEAAAGLERAKLFSWDRSAEITLDVYRDLARQGPRKRRLG
jgi:glycosyltransferase involved in cell wall biosynthesis